MASMQHQYRWWKEAVVYQVYPASFHDANGDGWGDIKGITSKLDHIKDLGADVLWISPVFKSPQVDMGYDISDYKQIDPRFGTIEDVDELIAELKKRDMRLMLDLVVNHTSDQHAWFKESRASKSSEKRDWYIWKPAKRDAQGNRKPPSNWVMRLGEGQSAWNWDEDTQEYYLAIFTPSQPDLNWDNPDVRHAVFDVMRFWLERGCSGFRMDVINHISKHPDFPDAPVVMPESEFQPGNTFFANGPRLHEYLKEMHRTVLSKYDAISVGEMGCVDDEREIIKSVGAGEEELNMAFIFDLTLMDSEPQSRLSLKSWSVDDFRRIVSKWQTFMIENGGWNAIWSECHDEPRSVSRWTDDSKEYRAIGSKLLALMHTTLSGTPYIYQGQEIGMKSAPLEWDISEFKDIETKNYWQKMQQLYPNNREKEQYAKQVVHAKARDHARTPMQWDRSPNAGFCPSGVQPWMRVVDDYETWNAALQRRRANTESVFHFWKQGLERRKQHKQIFVYGGFEVVDCTNPNVFAYKRTSKDKGDWLVVLNMTKKEVTWNIPRSTKVERWVTGTYASGGPDKATRGKIILRAFEGLLAPLR